MSQKWF